MKVILTADIKNVGQKGDQKEVKPGYARNFLFPRKLAIVADSDQGKEMLAAKEIEEEKQQEEAGKAAKISIDNQNLKISFERKASKEGKLFGSVSTKEIKEAAEKKLGIKIQSLSPNSALKQTGEHKISLQLPGEQTLDISVKVSPLTEKGK